MCARHACDRHRLTQALKAGSASRGGESRLVGFASSNVEYVEHAFKQDTIGLQTKAQFAEKVRLACAEHGGGAHAALGLTCGT